MRKLFVESRGFHILRNRQFPQSLQIHFLGLSSMSIVFSCLRRVLPTNKASDKFFRKISFDPPMIVRYLPREVSIFRQLSYLRMSNGSGKLQKRYLIILWTMDLFIEFQIKIWAVNLLILVKNLSKLGRIKTTLGPTIVGIIDVWIPYFTSYTKAILLIPAFSMQWHNIPFMFKTIFNHFALVIKSIGDISSGIYSSNNKQST